MPSRPLKVKSDTFEELDKELASKFLQKINNMEYQKKSKSKIRNFVCQTFHRDGKKHKKYTHIAYR